MTSEWKLVPVEPTIEMLRRGGRNLHTRDIYAAMLAAAPQPPALGGEPIKRYAMGVYNKLIEATSGEWVRLEDHCAHVAPLLAEIESHQGELAGAQAMLETAYEERDTLKAEVERLNNAWSVTDAGATKLLSELTKARELFEVILEDPRLVVAMSSGLLAPIKTLLAQAAPAAKDGE